MPGPSPRSVVIGPINVFQMLNPQRIVLRGGLPTPGFFFDDAVAAALFKA